jgi:hypothetical protein
MNEKKREKGESHCYSYIPFLLLFFPTLYFSFLFNAGVREKCQESYADKQTRVELYSTVVTTN